MRLSELDFQNSVEILENIKKKLLEVKQDKSALPEGKYEEFKADMFDGLELPFTINLLISDRDKDFQSNSTVSRDRVNNETAMIKESVSSSNQPMQKEET